MLKPERNGRTAHDGHLERRGHTLVVFLASVSVALASTLVRLHALQPGQSEFVPVTGAVTEQLPAAPLLIVAYAFVWVALLFYLWTIWRRLNKVETEMEALGRRTAQRGSAR